MDRFHIAETDLESAEQEVELIESRNHELVIRENALENALRDLTDDIEVALSLEKNSSELDREKLDNEQRMDAIRQKIQDIQSQLQEQQDISVNSRSVLEELCDIGENVSESLQILEERQRMIDEYSQRLQELAERLDMDAGLSEASVGNQQIAAASGECRLEEAVDQNSENKSTSGLNEFQGSDFRLMTPDEARDIQNRTGMSDASIGRCLINADGIVKMRCINEDLLGEPLPAPYVEQIVDLNGVQIRTVMPQFPDVRFRVQLPQVMYCASDYLQFKYCVQVLKVDLLQNPEKQRQFTKKQLRQIMAEEHVITGLVWHHGAQCGDMQLIPVKWHDKYRHTGGKAIWGGGRP